MRRFTKKGLQYNFQSDEIEKIAKMLNLIF